MNRNPSENESEFDEIPGLEAEIELFKKELADCIAKRRELQEKEISEPGVFFASEIFQLSQDKLRLQVEIELREKKIRRIRLGISDADMFRAGEPMI